MENYTVENIIKNKQCVYCGAEEKLKQQTFVVQEETKIEFKEYDENAEKVYEKEWDYWNVWIDTKLPK